MSRSTNSTAQRKPLQLGTNRLACLIASASGFAVILVLERLLPGGLPAVLIAWSLLTGWYCGRWTAIGLAIATGVMLLLMAPHPSASHAAGLVISWGVTVGLICWITALRQEWQIEHRLARQDTLTGLANRQAIFERCQAELSRARRFQRPMTVVLLDADSFKSINDRYGHPAGDLVLCRAAAALSETIRQYDLVGRLGGDEFVILLPEVGEDDARIVVQRLQAALQTHVEQLHPSLTFSIGAVTLLPSSWDVAQCLAEADRLLYLAKRAGKNTAHFETVDGPATAVRER